jgi:hypothetical protein
MRFKQYLQELTSIESGQAVQAHEPTDEASSHIDNARIRMELNLRLVNELNQVILSPETGIQSIRKVLHRYGFDIPALYDADPEGDEVIIEIDQFGQPLGGNVFSVTDWQGNDTSPNDQDEDGEEDTNYNIYILYYLTDDGYYEFFAEVGDDSRMEELISEMGDEVEEN